MCHFRTSDMATKPTASIAPTAERERRSEEVTVVNRDLWRLTCGDMCRGEVKTAQQAQFPV
jgi:hypothetical protein